MVLCRVSHYLKLKFYCCQFGVIKSRTTAYNFADFIDCVIPLVSAQYQVDAIYSIYFSFRSTFETVSRTLL